MMGRFTLRSYAIIAVATTAILMGFAYLDSTEFFAEFLRQEESRAIRQGVPAFIAAIVFRPAALAISNPFAAAFFGLLWPLAVLWGLLVPSLMMFTLLAPGLRAMRCSVDTRC